MTLGAVWTGERAPRPRAGRPGGRRRGDPVAADRSYDPATDTWSELTEAPNSDEIDAFNTMAWTGEELLVAQRRRSAAARATSTSSLLRWSPDDGWTDAAHAPARRAAAAAAAATSPGPAPSSWSAAATSPRPRRRPSRTSSSRRTVKPTEAERELLRATPPSTSPPGTRPRAPGESSPTHRSATYNDSWRYPGVFTDHEVVTWELDPKTLDANRPAGPPRSVHRNLAPDRTATPGGYAPGRADDLDRPRARDRRRRADRRRRRSRAAAASRPTRCIAFTP